MLLDSTTVGSLSFTVFLHRYELLGIVFERERESTREFVRQRWREREIEILGSGLFIGSLTKEMGTDIYWVLTTYQALSQTFYMYYFSWSL